MTDNDDLRERVARELREAIEAWDSDGDPEVADDLARIVSTHDRMILAALSATPIEALQQRVERLEGAARWLASQQTTEEALTSGPPGWNDMTLEQRLEAIGKRKEDRDAAIMNARAALGDDVG